MLESKLNVININLDSIEVSVEYNESIGITEFEKKEAKEDILKTLNKALDGE